jgi:hypothetical protein
MLRFLLIAVAHTHPTDYVTALPVQVEVSLLQAYALLRQYPIVALVCFYCTLALLLRCLSKLFARAPSHHFQVTKEASSASLIAAVKAELESCKAHMRQEARPTEVKESLVPVQQLFDDLQEFSKLHKEFQLEMLESHKDLRHTLAALQVRSQRPDEDDCMSGPDDDLRLDEISHNASFGSSINPPYSFSIADDGTSPIESRKDSVNSRMFEQQEEEQQPAEAPSKQDELSTREGVTRGFRPELPVSRTRQKLVAEVPTRAKFVPPAAAKNPFGL